MMETKKSNIKQWSIVVSDAYRVADGTTVLRLARMNEMEIDGGPYIRYSRN